MDDLVQRLRALSRYAHDDRSIGDEAADEIELLTAERDALVEERDDANAAKEGYFAERNSARDAWRRVSAERDALQAKLDALMMECCPDAMTDEQRARWGKPEV